MTEELRTLYPPIEPFATRFLEVGGGHRLYVEEAGDPDGIPVVFLHGGPGGGLAPFTRRFFDPARYRIVLFDQRGSGRSTPAGSLHDNTTWHLVDDIEVIREALGIAAWLVFGGSWGSTLALAYAETHPDRVTGLVLRGVFLVRAAERRWVYQDGLDRIQPEEWARFVAPIPEPERDDILAAYHRRLTGADLDEARRCADAWMRWEAIISSLVPNPDILATLTADDAVLESSRILAHYAVNGGFFEPETRLLDDVDRIRHLPCVIVQGRYDLCCPPVTAHDLARLWPEADLRIVGDAGHSSLEPGITHELITATDGFAAKLS
ncbi:prolyl aminopeptidase [Actinoplanes utahensis]|uniref:Proline iminopeptidase n=1 Tax=Actinoplanes utahensis TaxID=1869 RepID=A0A0A6UUN6_ACTUT|nr:prolyl aminopeptidase [Actinoplanes utahensis]KHD78169.1 proline iminopeptidase [Actinoplanes utahensis]GIF30672.1 proline iminopeptidase [Actinoplanes utahensis]